jgi:hypothetical protein
LIDEPGGCSLHPPGLSAQTPRLIARAATDLEHALSRRERKQLERALVNGGKVCLGRVIQESDQRLRLAYRVDLAKAADVLTHGKDSHQA